MGYQPAHRRRTLILKCFPSCRKADSVVSEFRGVVFDFFFELRFIEIVFDFFFQTDMARPYTITTSGMGNCNTDEVRLETMITVTSDSLHIRRFLVLTQ